MKKGTLCISLDTELIWGRVHLHNIDSFKSRARKDWKTIPEILTLLKKYSAPATWAVTGHMMLKSCDGCHLDLVRPRYKNQEFDWFKYDPGTDEKQNPDWYGKSLFLKIKSTPKQEIASHTYSHFFWGQEGCTHESAESDMNAWIRVAKSYGITATSFVFPKNSVGHLSLLKKNGFTTYRGPDINWFSTAPNIFKHILQILDFLLPVSPSSVKVSKNAGLINIPGSYYFPSARGIRKYIPKGLRAYKAKRGIDSAIKKGEIFHLWSHPIDFADQTSKLMYDFEEILAYANKKVVEGKLEIKSMKEISLSYKN